MQKRERQAELLRLAREAGGFVGLSILAENTGVSVVTIRRDADELAAAGQAVRNHGGIMVAEREPTVTLEPSFLTRSHLQESAKEAIAARAATLVHPGSTIAIDTGTTTLAFSKALHRISDLTIVTSSLVVAGTCADRHTVHMLGGRVRPGELSVVGGGVQAHLRDFQIDQAFIGVAGITDHLGDYSFDDAQVKRGLIGRADRVVVLADAAKLGKRAAAVICPLDAVNTLITDAAPHPDFIAQLGDVELLIARDNKEEESP